MPSRRVVPERPVARVALGEEIADGRTTTDAIEEDLYRHRQELFGEGSIAFFDTTSLYFEGAGGPIDFDANGDITANMYDIWVTQADGTNTIEDTITFSPEE